MSDMWLLWIFVGFCALGVILAAVGAIDQWLDSRPRRPRYKRQRRPER